MQGRGPISRGIGINSCRKLVGRGKSQRLFSLLEDVDQKVHRQSPKGPGGLGGGGGSLVELPTTVGREKLVRRKRTRKKKLQVLASEGISSKLENVGTMGNHSPVRT